MDIDEDGIKPMLLAIQANAFKSIGQCFPFIKNQQELHSNSTLEFLSNNLANQVWNIRISVLEAIQLICEKISTTGVLASDATVQTVISGVTICLQDGKYRNVRDQATQTLKLFLRNGTIDVEINNLVPRSLYPSLLLIITPIAETERDGAIQSNLNDILEQLKE